MSLDHHIGSSVVILSQPFAMSWLFSPVLPSALSPAMTSGPAQPKQATVTGLLECRKRDETKLIKNLITGKTKTISDFSLLRFPVAWLN